MKFLADPASRRACTERETPEAVRFTIEVRGCILSIAGLMTLTMGLGGRIGHIAIPCPSAPQYKHKPRVSRL